MTEWYYGDIIQTIQDIQKMKKDIAEIKDHVEFNTQFCILLFKDKPIENEARLYMDAMIRKIEKEVPKKSKAKKDLKHLEKMDKKRDKVVEKAEKIVKKKKK